MSERAGPPADIGFPARRPEIAVEALEKKPFAVDCRQLRSFFIVPEPGERARWAMYEAPGWDLAGVTDLRATRPAVVHEVKGVEIEVVDRDREHDWRPERWTMYGRLMEETAEWLATVTMDGDSRRVYTFLDDGFDDDWGKMKRRLEDRGELVRQADGSFVTRADTDGEGMPEDVGAGVFRVLVGGLGFDCLCAIDVQGDPDMEHGILQEAFVTRSGRTVLSRRYNASLWDRRRGKRPTYGTRPTWEEELPGSARLVLDGVTYVHWYDCLSDFACGAAGAPG